MWEYDFIIQPVSCSVWDFHFQFSFRWRLRQTQTSATRWIDGTWNLRKQKYFSVSFFNFIFAFLYLIIWISQCNLTTKVLNKNWFLSLWYRYTVWMFISFSATSSSSRNGSWWWHTTRRSCAIQRSRSEENGC